MLLTESVSATSSNGPTNQTPSLHATVNGTIFLVHVGILLLLAIYFSIPLFSQDFLVHSSTSYNFK